MKYGFTPDEIKTRFSLPAAPPPGGVVGDWSFNNLSTDQQMSLAREELRQQLYGSNGVFALNAEARGFYPAATLAEISRLERERDELQKKMPPEPEVALAVAEASTADVPVYLRGNHLTPGKEMVPRGFLQVVQKVPCTTIPTDESGRVQLADWLTHPEHPLTARVMINRIWQGHFGAGLVRTADNFGVRGEAPTHPALLDWLAREFILERWSVKAMHRLIMLSQAYQRSTTLVAKSASADPENRLLWRMNRRRLEAEPIHDAILAVAGALDMRQGGTLMDEKNSAYARSRNASPDAAPRRAIYLPVNRSLLNNMFSIFDFADPAVPSSQRYSTVVSHQALFFMNSPMVIEQAREFARSLLAMTDADDGLRIRTAYLRALARPPNDTEGRRALDFLRKAGELVSPDPEKQSKHDALPAWQAFCQTLLASNEFLYLD
jgi:hypothetical protein